MREKLRNLLLHWRGTAWRADVVTCNCGHREVVDQYRMNRDDTIVDLILAHLTHSPVAVTISALHRSEPFTVDNRTVTLTPRLDVDVRVEPTGRMLPDA